MNRSVLAAIVALAFFACTPEDVGPPPDAGSSGAGRDAGEGADAEGGPSGDGAAAMDAAATLRACADNAYARCTRLAECSPVAVQLRFGDLATCEAIFKQFCLNNLAAPSTGATAATAEGCAQAIPNWDCADYLFTQNMPPECGMAAGTLSTGATCAFPGQCESAFCAIAPGAACGTCASAPKAGDSCEHLTTCGLTFSCEDATNKCAAFATLGAACGPGLPCGAGLGCVGGNTMANGTGTCQQAIETVGGACVPTGPGCDLYAGLICNSSSSQCARVQIANGGQSCGDVNHQTAYCAAQGDCIGAGTAPGVCRASAPVGAACDLAMGPHCIPPARCIRATDGGAGGTCLVPSAALCR
jgi:hypothetical protein